jgi:hypothetical protein
MKARAFLRGDGIYLSQGAMTRERRTTLVAIFAIENRWMRLSEICNHIIAKIDRRGAGSLTAVERNIDRVNDFEYRMIRGGLSAFLYADWLDWKAIREIAGSLEVVGARDAARLLNQMVTLVTTALERQPAILERTLDQTDADAKLAWGDLLGLIDPHRELDRIEQELAPHIDGLNRHLLEYVETHRVDLLRADEASR